MDGSTKKLLSFTHPRVIRNLYDFLCGTTMKVNEDWSCHASKLSTIKV